MKREFFLRTMPFFCVLQADGVRDCFTDYKEQERCESRDSPRAQENLQRSAHDIQVTGVETTNSNAWKRRFEELT